MSEQAPYGYGKRPPTSTGRVIPAGTPPSRVNAPDSSSSRKVSAVAKQVQETAVPIFTSGFTTPALVGLTDLNTIPVADGGPPGWSAWEYNGAANTYQGNTFTAIQNGTATTGLVARSNADVMTERMRCRMSAYRAADATGMAVYMALGVPDTTLASYLSDDYWRVGMVRQGSGTANVVAQYIPYAGAGAVTIVPAVSAITWANNSVMNLFVEIDGGVARVYTNAVDDFDTATFRMRFPIPVSHWNSQWKIRNKRAGIVIDRGSATNMWVGGLILQSSPGAFAP